MQHHHDPGPSLGDIHQQLERAHELARIGEVSRAVEGYRVVGAALVARNALDSAIAVYTTLHHIVPDCLHTQGMLADLHRRMGRVVEAAAGYEAVAQVHLGHGRLHEAMQVYRIVVQVDPGTVPRRVQLAELYVQLQMFDVAVAELEVAVRQLAAGQRYDELVWVARRLLELQPGHALTLTTLIRAHLLRRDLPAAVAGLQTLRSAAPLDDLGCSLLAEAFAVMGRCDLAARTLVLLAQRLRRRGPADDAEAKRLLRQAVEWYPEDRQAQRELAAVEGELAARSRQTRSEARAAGLIDLPFEDEDAAAELEEDITILEVQPDPSLHGRVIYGRFGVRAEA